MIVHTLTVCEDTDPPHGVVVLKGSLEEVRAVAHLLGQDLEITAKPEPDLGGWVSGFETFWDCDGHEYTPEGAMALFRDGRPVAWVTERPGAHDLAAVFDHQGSVTDLCEFSPSMSDEQLTVARRWCEAQLTEMATGDEGE